MSFGKQSGPPASAAQVAYLERLLHDAGYETFRDARHPLDLTQRQSAGKFTRHEASELIDRLLGASPEDDDAPPPELPSTPPSAPATVPTNTPAPRSARQQRDADRAEFVRGLPAQVLADELTRRGWTITEPGPAP